MAVRRELQLPENLTPAIFDVDGREILVFDGIFSDEECAVLDQTFRGFAFRLNDIDSPDKAYARHWKAELDPAAAGTYPGMSEVVQIVEFVYESFGVRLIRTHCNLSMYGDLQFPHRDCAPGTGVTALLFANAVWKTEWTGETLFFNDDGDARCAVSARPGRILIFDGSILHRAGVPSREVFEPRLTVAFKYLFDRSAGEGQLQADE